MLSAHLAQQAMIKEHEGFGPKLSKVRKCQKKLHRQFSFFPFAQACCDTASSSPPSFAPNNFYLNLCNEEKRWLLKSCSSAALSCFFNLQPLAWFSGTAMRGQSSKAPSGVSGEILALPRGFSVQCKVWITSWKCFCPFCRREPVVNNCLYHALWVFK